MPTGDGVHCGWLLFVVKKPTVKPECWPGRRLIPHKLSGRSLFAASSALWKAACKVATPAQSPRDVRPDRFPIVPKRDTEVVSRMVGERRSLRVPRAGWRPFFQFAYLHECPADCIQYKWVVRGSS